MLPRSDTVPSFLASVVAKWPVLSALFLLLLMLGASAPAALPSVRPIMNNDFASLLIKDHPSAADAFAATTVEDRSKFWDQPSSRRRAAQRRRLAAADGDSDFAPFAASSVGSDDSTAAQRAFLGALETARGMPRPDGEAADAEAEALQVAADGGRALLQGAAPGYPGGRRCDRTSRNLNLFYRWSDNSTTITDAMVAKVRRQCHRPCRSQVWRARSAGRMATRKVTSGRRWRRVQAKAVEDEIFALDSYKLICLTQDDGTCHHAFGLPSLVYAEPRGGGSNYDLADTCAPLASSCATAHSCLSPFPRQRVLLMEKGDGHTLAKPCGAAGRWPRSRNDQSCADTRRKIATEAVTDSHASRRERSASARTCLQDPLHV